jgi:hypothetical protein
MNNEPNQSYKLNKRKVKLNLDWLEINSRMRNGSSPYRQYKAISPEELYIFDRYYRFDAQISMHEFVEFGGDEATVINALNEQGENNGNKYRN